MGVLNDKRCKEFFVVLQEDTIPSSSCPMLRESHEA